MQSKFQPFDIKVNCRVYFIFVDNEDKNITTYYERPQFFSDKNITDEALVNAEDMILKFNLKELIGIFIARTEAQVLEFENKFT